MITWALHIQYPPCSPLSPSFCFFFSVFLYMCRSLSLLFFPWGPSFHPSFRGFKKLCLHPGLPSLHVNEGRWMLNTAGPCAYAWIDFQETLLFMYLFIYYFLQTLHLLSCSCFFLCACRNIVQAILSTTEVSGSQELPVDHYLLKKLSKGSN